MTKRPMLILNGKPMRYCWLYVKYAVSYMITVHLVEVDDDTYPDAKVSYGSRDSGRRIIWVSTEVEDERLD